MCSGCSRNTRLAPGALKVVLTNYAQVEYQNLSVRLGADRIFEKSLEMSQALALIETMAAERRGIRAPRSSPATLPDRIARAARAASRGHSGRRDDQFNLRRENPSPARPTASNASVAGSGTDTCCGLPMVNLSNPKKSLLSALLRKLTDENCSAGVWAMSP